MTMEKTTTTRTTTTHSMRRRAMGGLALATLAGVMTSGARAAESKQDTTTGLERFQLHGSGTTNPSKLFWWAMDLLEERSKSDVRMTYRSVGSGVGQNDITTKFADTADFASTDYGLAPGASGKEIYQIPFQIGGVSLFHNVPGIATGALKLSACTIIKIYKGEITTWNHGDIQADNPDLTLPAEKIKLVYRSNGSSSTHGVKGYMNEVSTTACPTGWPAVSASSFPSTTTVQAHSSVYDVAYAVTGSDTMRIKIGETPYSLGYIDSGHGHADDLSEIAMKNADGQWVVTKTGNPAGRITADITKAAETVTYPKVTGSSSTDYAGNWSGINLHHKAGDKAWPITLFTYIHLKKTYTDQDTKMLARAFAEFILSDEVQTKTKDFMFEPLPSSVVTSARNFLSTTMTGGTPWQFLEADGTSTDTANTMNNPRTFSKRRQAYVDYALGLVTKDIAQLEASVAKLTKESAGHKENDDAADKRTIALAAVAFVFAMASLILNVVLLCCKRQRHAPLQPPVSKFQQSTASFRPTSYAPPAAPATAPATTSFQPATAPAPTSFQPAY